MTWIAVKAALQVVFGFLRAVPWQVWVALVLAGLVWHWGGTRYDAGVTAERERWEAAQAVAISIAEVEQAKRDRRAAQAAAEAAAAAQAATIETRSETAAAVEKIRYVTRTIEVPAHCPVGLPDSVYQEGREAVARARTAARGL